MKPTDKKVNVTFSIPVELNNMLHATIDRRKLSNFVAQALKHALKDKKLALEQAYMQANKDTDRLKTIEEWKAIDEEGWND